MKTVILVYLLLFRTRVAIVFATKKARFFKSYRTFLRYDVTNDWHVVTRVASSCAEFKSAGVDHGLFTKFYFWNYCI